MTWKIKFTTEAEKQLEKLDKKDRKRIENYFNERLAVCDNPKDFGSPLQENLKGYWRYRVGNYRLICKIIDDQVVIVVIKIGHRKLVYKKPMLKE